MFYSIKCFGKIKFQDDDLPFGRVTLMYGSVDVDMAYSG
jgi:hypothetical protein